LAADEIGTIWAAWTVLLLRGISITEYFSAQDPISGMAYYAMLVVFAIMPLLVRLK